MKRLLNGIMNFRKKHADYRNKFAKLHQGQSPEALVISCCDSRVVPNIFTATDPGELFVLRNIGNLVPPHLSAENSVAAAIEYALQCLHVTDIIVCGHANCGAMHALLENNVNTDLATCEKWLKNATASYEAFKQTKTAADNLSQCDRLSQINVIQQLNHLKTYPEIVKRLQDKKLRLHGWWFDLKTADIFCYDEMHKKFVLLDEIQAKKMLSSEFKNHHSL